MSPEDGDGKTCKMRVYESWARGMERLEEEDEAVKSPTSEGEAVLKEKFLEGVEDCEESSGRC